MAILSKDYKNYCKNLKSSAKRIAKVQNIAKCVVIFRAVEFFKAVIFITKF